jgi:hypothetical protein
MRLAATCLLAILTFVAPATAAPDWRLDEERSSFVVLTHKAGIGARLGHDHLVVARGARTVLRFDPDRPQTTRFSFELPVLALDVDPQIERAALGERLKMLGVLEDELPPIEAKDRAKIRKAMLDARQLFAERFPEVRAELVALEHRSGEGNARVALGWDARVRIVLRGQAVERRFPARWELDGDELSVEILGELRFTEFGIEPYSALLGAIRNADLFHLYVSVVARRESQGGS